MDNDLLNQVVEAISSSRLEVAEIEAEYAAKRTAATAAALELCPKNIQDWLIECTESEDEPGVAWSSQDPYSTDSVEWFEVGHNSSHYFSFGVRSDGVFIARTSGPEYSHDCQCWYDSTTVKVISANDVYNRYWGHRQPLGKNLTFGIIKKEKGGSHGYS